VISPVVSTRDRIGRILLALLAVSTLGAFATGIVDILAAGPDTLVVQSWRATGYLVFAGLFALLAARPRDAAWVWELVVVQKAAVTVIGFANIGAADAVFKSSVDLVLVVVMTIGWVLCRGWLSWHREPAAAPAAPAFATA
jgi:hypothetical protein